MESHILKSSIPYKAPRSENLLEFIKNGLRQNSHNPLIVNGLDGTEWTGQQLEYAIGRVAKILINDCGVKKGDVISLFEKDQDRVAIVLLAIICVGATCKLISTTIKDASCTIQASHVKLVITSEKYLISLKKELSDNNYDVKFVSLDKTNDENQLDIATQLRIDHQEEGLNLDHLIKTIQIIPDKDIAVIQFSSGTTGKPKRIPRTHKNLCHLVASVDHPELMDMQPGVRIFGSLQMGFRTGLWALLHSINSGSTFIIKSKGTLHEVLGEVAQYKPTIWSMSVIDLTELSGMIVEKSKEFDISSVKEIITAGAKIVNYDVANRIADVLNITSIRQCFGMTESGWCFLLEKSLSKKMYLTVGHAVPNMEVIIMDVDTGQRLGPLEKGEIALRGPQVFPGYMTDNGPNVYNRSDFTTDGWFKIGDEGYYTEEGLVYVCGRYKELLTFQNMERMYPDQIEAVLLKHPNIEKTCVVKVPGKSDELYDTARAYITIRLNSDLDETGVINYLKKESPLVIMEGGIRFLDTFPRLANGKVNKQALKNML